MGVTWQDVFGNDRPVEIEIGPGRGEMLLAYATTSPATNFFAIERAPGRADALQAKAIVRGLDNVRVVAGDARCVLGRLVPTASVTAYHIFFPDPWPKRRHGKRRLFTDLEFARQLGRTLVHGGAVHVATDLPAVLDAMCEVLVAAGLNREVREIRMDRPRTSFERRYALDGTHYARFSLSLASEKTQATPT
jgi:tRNA (guanine-N7-)-methyltransferase